MKDQPSIAVIGLGYVGLPLAIEFSRKYSTFGFDKDLDRIKQLKNSYDKTLEVEEEEIDNSSIFFTEDTKDIANCNIYIITVPTPVNSLNEPDLTPLSLASAMIGKLLKKDDVVIYESTVYPGATEEFCVPILEQKSNLIFNMDFYCGYSPERINPGDKEHSLTTITKITSGSNLIIADYIDGLYNSIITAGTHKASSIKVAEAAKVIENIQRDVNIALINELSIIFKKLNLDTSEILEAAGSKWNFMPFRPGLVGGHCIGVDPYYLTYKATEIGYHPEMILSGRRINDNMGKFIADCTVAELAKKNIDTKSAKVAILGITFKENCPDIRNTKIPDIINHLKVYKCKIYAVDPFADIAETKLKYNVDLLSLDQIAECDAVIIAVAHDEYKLIAKEDWQKLLKNKGVLIDVKSILSKNYFIDTDITHWRL